MKKKGPGRRRSKFKAEWAKLPSHWMEALRRSKSINTYRLALIILFEAFKQEQIGGEIVLSTAMTGMDRATRKRAIDELVRLKLIVIKQANNKATRVIDIYNYK